MEKQKNVYHFSMEWAGRKLSIERGRLANQATYSLKVQYGDTVVLGTVVRSKNQREDINYFPLMVDYEEKLYAAGKIKGSRFIKREGRPTDEAILNGRMVDRAIRPLFNDKDRNDIQVILSILSIDQENLPGVISLIAASFALYLSPIDWKGPIGGVQIGRLDGKFIANPTYEELEKGDLDLIIAGTGKKIIMIEAGAKEVNEEDMFEAMEFAKKQISPLLDFLKKIAEELPKQKKIQIKEEEKNSALTLMEKFLEDNLEKHLFDKNLKTKMERKEALDILKEDLLQYLIANNIEEDDAKTTIKKMDKYVYSSVSQAIIKREQRVDGRKMNEIRKISSEVALLPRTHGSGLFNRGETQVMSVVTLGPPSAEQILDGMEKNGTKRYMHHYNFPPFSVGETGFMRGPSRRDIGHGALAEKALLPVLPNRDDFPYTIRVVSETLSSNGSSSMGAVCGSTLSLMDAGVPIKKPVAGIAIGMSSNKDMSEWKIITDIQDLEDGEGGMDFKVAGTRDGITAIQLDTKTLGINSEITKQALQKALEARLKILNVIEDTIKKPRKELSKYAPRVISLKINPEKIRTVIGPGGKMINKIIDETGVNIDIEDDGTVFISSVDGESMDKAVQWVKNLTHEVKTGELYQGTVKRIMDFGAFVEVLPGQEGLVHISELSYERTNKVEDVVKIGDIIPVKVIEIDKVGRINLSYKDTQPKPDHIKEKPFIKKTFNNRGPRRNSFNKKPRR
ncbi:MAG: polyribonucleotide nucleotidyltransferase [Xanthomonadaceae bacterium]|nr:polyribonucleotide nucleotidyltransferase [Rhodospirillaceae bacterium]NIA17944.1 polyribonucleotide nucleotidyltransferase [Xanthomonadaceae bacterium]